MNLIIKKTFHLIIMFSIIGCARVDYSKQFNKYYFRLNETPKTIDPSLVVDVTEGELCVKVFSGLLRFNDELKIVPDLAQNYSISDDGLTINFELREHLTFSDGSKLTSQDVFKSWKRLLNPKKPSPRKWVLDHIKGIDDFYSLKSNNISGFIITDDLNFKIILKSRFAPFLSLLTMPSAAIVKVRENGDLEQDIFSGPYQILNWKKDQFIELVPNENYYQKGARPNIIYKIIPEDSSAIAMFATGELDLIKIPRNQISILKSKFTNKTYYQIEELNTYYLGFNHRNDLIDLPFKKACDLAIDRDLIIKSIFSGNAKKAITPVPPVLLQGLDFKYEKKTNLVEAKECFSNSKLYGKKIIFLVPSKKEALSVSVIIQDQLKRVGVDIDLHVLDWSAFKEAVSNGDGDMFYMSWWADYADSENFLFPTFYSLNEGSLGNRTYYKNKKVDILLKKLQVEYDSNSKKSILKDLIQILNNDLPWISLWHRMSVFGASNKINGFSPKPLYTMDKGLSLKIKD